MNVHHKVKERLRHRRQNELLNDVMKLVPKPLNGSSLKVHAQISKNQPNNLKDHKKSTKKSAKSASKSIMEHCETRKKPPRANIIFLQADLSKKQSESSTDLPILKGNCPEESVVNSEYKVPEVVVVNNMDDSNVFNYNLFLPNNSNLQTISNNSGSTSEFSISDLATEDNNYGSKINHSEITTNIFDNDQVIEQLPAYNKKVPENILNIDEDLVHNRHKKTDFQNILKDYSNNSTLNSETEIEPYDVNESTCIRNMNSSLPNSHYIVEAYPFQNTSGYPNLLSENVSLANNNLNYKNLYYFDSAMNESQLYSLPMHGNTSGMLGNVSDNCSNSTVTDNLHIDVENFSDSSSGSSKIIADGVHDLNVNNAYVTPTALVYDLPYTTLMNYDDFALPFVSSDPNFENYNGQNELPVWPVSYIPYINSVSPNNISFNEIPSIIQSSEPIVSFQDELMNSQFISDQVSFYSPHVLKDVYLERLPKSAKTETITSESSIESFSIETKPELFDEEVSYPLCQYINNY